jgi:Nucleotidyl transferase AbiEii toxin, Type IV TA system
LLGEYRDDIVVVGGWVPALLFPECVVLHTGSIDVDLALDHRKLQEAGYRTIRALLLSRGYQPGVQPFIFHRRVNVGNREISVEVDLLAGEYEGTGKSHRTQRVQDVRPRKARGCELAFNRPSEVIIEGSLPGGGTDSARVRVASIVPFIVMKGMAMHDRLKEKDAYDIHFCIQYYPGGLQALVQEFRPHALHGLIREGLCKIAEKFASPDHVGPRFVADFLQIDEPEEREALQRDTYERVNYLLAELGIR